MSRPAAGDLVTCPWEPDEPGAATSFRIVAVVGVRAGGIDVVLYGNRFASPPAEVNVRTLRRARPHEMLGGPASVPWAEFATWDAMPVRRADVRAT